jgi:hypothetical protein
MKDYGRCKMDDGISPRVGGPKIIFQRNKRWALRPLCPFSVY